MTDQNKTKSKGICSILKAQKRHNNKTRSIMLDLSSGILKKKDGYNRFRSQLGKLNIEYKLDTIIASVSNLLRAIMVLWL